MSRVLYAGNAAEHVAIAGLDALLALMYWAVIVRHREWWEHPGIISAYFAVTLPMFFALLSFDTVYFILASAFYMQVFRFLRMPYAIGWALVVTAIMIGHLVIAAGASVLTD